MTNHQQAPAPIAVAVSPHQHHRHAIRVTVGANCQGLRIDYKCDECGVVWSEHRVNDEPLLRRKPDRRTSR